MGYSAEERETVLVYSDETKEWTVYSTVPKHIRKLNTLTKLDILETENDNAIAIRGTLKEKQVSMKNLRVLTEDQKKKAAERMSKMWENQR